MVDFVMSAALTYFMKEVTKAPDTSSLAISLVAEICAIQRDELTVWIHTLLPDTYWYEDEVWAGWATQLDSSNIWYVLPDEYEILAFNTGLRPMCLKARCGAIDLRILGIAVPEQVAGRLWRDDLPVDGTICQWASAVYEDMKNTGREELWQKAFIGALEYFKHHRHLVRCAGHLLGIDMDDHDLTKTKLFHYALGYLWHWSAEQCDQMKDLAWKVVRERHLTQEDHHPEFMGQVDALKLFTDRLSVGIQKSTRCDGEGG